MIWIRTHSTGFYPPPKIIFGYYHPPRSFQSLRAVGPSYQKKTPKLAATADPLSARGPTKKRMVIAATTGFQTDPRPLKMMKITRSHLAEYLEANFFLVSYLRSEKVCD